MSYQMGKQHAIVPVFRERIRPYIYIFDVRIVWLDTEKTDSIIGNVAVNISTGDATICTGCIDDPMSKNMLQECIKCAENLKRILEAPVNDNKGSERNSATGADLEVQMI